MTKKYAMRVEGLKQFQRDLKALDADLPKALRLAHNEAANVIVDVARPKVPSKTGKAKRSVKARSTRAESRVFGGGNRVSYFPFLDFGGRVGKGRTGRGTGSVHRPYLKDGRYIYQVYFQKRDSGEFQEVLANALIDVARQAGIEVT